MDCLLQYHWFVEFFLGIVFLIVLYFLSKKAIRVAERGFRRKISIEKEKWKKIFFPAIKIIFLSVFAYYIANKIAACFSMTQVVQNFKPIRDTLIILSFAWMAYRAKQIFVQNISISRGQALSKILSIALILVTSLIILGIFHVDVVPLLAFGGIGAAVLGLAAKDVMSSFFGGIMLAVTRPFTVGDLILIPERNLEGTIEEMGWNVTLIRNKDRCAVYLPNTLFSQLLVINLSQRTGRRILETFHLRHEDFDKLFPIMSEVRELLLKYSAIDQQVPVLVYMSATGKYSIEFSIDIYTLVTALADYVVVKEEVLKQIASVILKNGARLAQPIILSEAPKE
ncbi:MAG: mechanosensitive ion channel [Verrucomicrobia bacterium]|nr:mechanosensitive ion channel [Verrucomicrobiota bacterium]